MRIRVAPGKRAAMDLAFAPRGQVELPKLVKQDIPEIGLKHVAAAAPPVAKKKGSSAGDGKQPTKKDKGGCGCRTTGDAPGSAARCTVIDRDSRAS